MSATPRQRRWKSSARLFALASLFGALGCASIPKPNVLSDIDHVRESPSAVGAKRDAPTAFAVAEKLRNDAHAAFEAEDHAAAQLLGEQALAAYEEAVALARVVRADKQREGASLETKAKSAQLAELDQKHQKVAADIAAVERRVKVLRSLEPTSPSGEAGPAREAARWEAVRSLQLSARILCSASKMLASSKKIQAGTAAATALDAAQKGLAELETTVSAKPKAAPIDGAMRARADCLTALTKIRRSGVDAKKAAGSGDALLEALSELGHGTPSRDDRGVVVTMRNIFDGDALTKKADGALRAIGELAKKHGRFPVMVVVHDTDGLDATVLARGRSRGEKIVAALRTHLGTERVAAAVIAGNAKPVVDPKGPNKNRNARIDLVFVSPESL